MLFDLTRPRLVLENRPLGHDAFVLRVERRHDRPRAGQHFDVGLPGATTRPYSLYSGEEDLDLEFLVRRVEGGTVSPALATLRAGDRVQVEAPRGRFTLAALPQERLLFLATGTGIAPFRSYLKSRSGLDYTLVHGVRTAADDFGAAFAAPGRRVLCVSGPDVPAGTFAGRITSWLDGADLRVYDRVYLCGNTKMILDALDRLTEVFPEDRIKTETYF